ncbi:hypothetical protein QOT17_000915 [Balamuthia mandrillaris]
MHKPQQGANASATVGSPFGGGGVYPPRAPPSIPGGSALHPGSPPPGVTPPPQWGGYRPAQQLQTEQEISAPPDHLYTADPVTLLVKVLGSFVESCLVGTPVEMIYEREVLGTRVADASLKDEFLSVYQQKKRWLGSHALELTGLVMGNGFLAVLTPRVMNVMPPNRLGMVLSVLCGRLTCSVVMFPFFVGAFKLRHKLWDGVRNTIPLPGNGLWKAFVVHMIENTALDVIYESMQDKANQWTGQPLADPWGPSDAPYFWFSEGLLRGTRFAVCALQGLWAVPLRSIRLRLIASPMAYEDPWDCAKKVWSGEDDELMRRRQRKQKKRAEGEQEREEEEGLSVKLARLYRGFWWFAWWQGGTIMT